MSTPSSTCAQSGDSPASAFDSVLTGSLIDQARAKAARTAARKASKKEAIAPPAPSKPRLKTSKIPAPSTAPPPPDSEAPPLRVPDSAAAETPPLTVQKRTRPRKSCTLLLVRRRDDHGDFCGPKIWQLTPEEADLLAAHVPAGTQELIANSAMDFATGVIWEKGPGSFKSAAQLYGDYKAQQQAAGKEPLSSYAFSRAMLHSARCVPAKIQGMRGFRCIEGDDFKYEVPVHSGSDPLAASVE